MIARQAGGLSRALLLGVFFIGAGTAFSATASDSSGSQAEQPLLTIEQYNQLRTEEKRARSLQFQEQWFRHLKGEKADLPDPLPAGWVRQATEEYLISSGGLKAAFGQASRVNTFGFTLTRPSDDPTREASFHRALRSIFTDVQISNRNRWLLNFVHEVAHALDSEMRKAIDIYSEPEFLEWLKLTSEKNPRLEELSPTDRARLDRWLLAGLNRGFLAEYRAFLVTFVVYEEGLKDGTFEPEREWEDLKATCPPGTNLQTHLFRTLSKDFVDPKIGPFKPDYIQGALNALRGRLYANPSLVAMGAIGPFVNISR